MPDTLNWSVVASRFLDSREVPTPVAELVARLERESPNELQSAIVPSSDARVKSAGAAFILMAIRAAVADHALTDVEVQEIRHVARALRVQEGDLLQHRREEVRELLCQELERLLEDRTIDPAEAVHKVKLQEVLGLSYDEFVALTESEIDKVVADLVGRLPLEADETTVRGSLVAFRERVAALDTVYNLNVSEGQLVGRLGYVYLLINPAMPGLVKIGQTTRGPEERVAELTSATGVPAPFLLAYHVTVSDAPAAETWIHQQLDDRGLRATTNREFFGVPMVDAVELMMRARDLFPV